jgi:hypothetical protein
LDVGSEEKPEPVPPKYMILVYVFIYEEGPHNCGPIVAKHITS